jgi:hypothetical protein
MRDDFRSWSYGGVMDGGIRLGSYVKEEDSGNKGARMNSEGLTDDEDPARWRG